MKTAFSLALCAALHATQPVHAATDAPSTATAAPSAAVLPGDDFFAYANADWLRTTRIPADRGSWGGMSQLADDTNQRIVKLIEAAGADQHAGAEARKVADFYRAYMDEAAIEARGVTPLAAELQHIKEISDKAGLTRALGASLRADVDPLNATEFHTENLFGLWVAQGLNDPRQNMPYLLQGGLGLPDRAYYLEDNERMHKLRTAYQAHIAAMLKLAGLSDPETRAARVYELERKLALSHASREDSADVAKANNTWSPRDFARKAPGMDWHAFFKSAGLGGQSKFMLWHPGAVTGAAALLKECSLDAWKDFLAFHTVNRNAASLPRAFGDQHFEFYGRTLSGTPQQAPRWKNALAAVNDGMPDAVGKLYVAKYFPPEAKARLETMVANIVQAFHRRIDKLDWMAPATRKEAHAKLDVLYVGIGYPERWTSYGELAVKPDDAYGNTERARKLRYAQQLAKLRQPVDGKEWCMPPHLVNAVNMPMQNALNFPAAILQPPFFDPQGPDAVNYGAIGSVIGHEISHSFDDTGAQFDSTGRLRDWWSAADAAHFKKATGALVAQYSAYQAFPDLKLNGQLTLSENLSDLAGVAAALDAFHATHPATVDGDRAFFIGYAQSWRNLARDASLRRQVMTDGHAPAQWRTYTVRNLDAWYQAFDVRPGQRLYLAPGERVKVW
ncbi:M13 family metallopeptidase [Pseudoduganella namucuonensis]|uniref:Endothelin-converting enzyme Metallo peptidase. MEROPS family M13 n=1 Tax=Pseudoduganella namucuonensis TaxID=1035707 RepID=A0A1I7I690_9BURK|nr:M13 family metallopeptidase [Pseudoduganella namucuonensis]SFU68452.1 endothelin-converting enzyme Metallo peptidase. MEROPS family M13 [Pseudoduganella namucuonensis]